MMNEFLTQLVRRFLGETPAFHKVIRTIGLVTAAIAAIPTFLQMSGLIEIIPGGVADIIAKVVSASGMVAAFIAQLAVTEAAKKQAEKAGKQIE